MANVAVIGAQWGDEGKGKIVDWLAERADMVVRFQAVTTPGTRSSSAMPCTNCRCCRRESFAARPA